MKDSSILIIVPPGTGGVRDFSDTLAIKLSELHSVTVSSWCKNNTDKIIQSAKSVDCVYLQYSGYGYAKRGAPIWLVSKLRKNRKHIKKLIIFFHELYAFGPIWSSAFWTSPLQRYVAQRLADTCDFWITNRELSSTWLRQRSGTKAHAVLPVFSNIGESDSFNPNRENKVVIFGSPHVRERAYREAGNLLFRWAKLHNLTVHDIGGKIDNPDLQSTLRDNKVTQHGYLEPANIRSLFRRAKFGIISYPVDYIAKSGIFSAYCAQGICSIVVSNHYSEFDNLKVNREYLPSSIFTKSELIESTTIGKASWGWYKDHSLDVHSSLVNKVLSQDG